MNNDVTTCRCDHNRDTHVHYRNGSDCGACGREGCASFRPASEVTDSVSALRTIDRFVTSKDSL
jgi:hypothetical protein